MAKKKDESVKPSAYAKEAMTTKDESYGVITPGDPDTPNPWADDFVDPDDDWVDEDEAEPA